MKYQYETLLLELQRYSTELARRHFAVAITKCDSLPEEDVNSLTQQFIEEIGLEVNNTLSQYKVNSNYLSYGFKEDFGVKLPINTPLFVLPISSISHLNRDPLRFALKSFVVSVHKEQEGN